MNLKLTSLSIIIPAYNDSETIGQVLTEAIYTGKTYSHTFEVIVSDDGSSDSTWETIQKVAQKYSQIKTLHHPKNMGFGNTIKELYYAAKNEYVFSIPGDRQIRAEILALLLPRLANSIMVIGYRRNRQDNILRLQQSALYNMLLRHFFQLPIHDVNSSKLFKRTLLDKIKLISTSAFIDAELCLETINHGLTITEVEISHHARTSGLGQGGNIKTVLPTFRDLVLYLLKMKSTAV